ncbi:MAG: hypothetical protein GX774_21335 [Armatimonadetes bacterium]|nr:hypothetical protein [Armatimonadota bacterium]
MAYLTFDIGTTALKSALIDEAGRMLALHTSEYALRTPQPDRAEMAPETYWRAAIEGARAVLTRSGRAPAEVAAIGFSSQGQSFVPLDRAGRPLHDVIVWVDNRAQAVADAWEAEWLSREEYHRISGYPGLPAGLTLFKIAWLAQHAPAAHRAWKFLCLPDYLIYRLTGETVTDRVIAQFSGLYDLRRGDWEPRLLAAAGIGPEQLPRLQEPGTVAGRLRPEAAAALGLPPGVPVCVGANDQIAGAVGAGNARPGIVTETTGTALALIATTETLLEDARLCVGRHAAPDACFAMAFTTTSAIVLKWLRDQCVPGQEYATFLAGVETIAPGCDGLTALPHFAGTGTPTYNPAVRGAFAGLTLAHTRAHLARAILEACACMLQECLEPIQAHGTHLDAIRSLGGAARSDLWLQIKADLLGIPVERPACPAAASLGAAILAATGVGHFGSIREGAEAWYRPARRFDPEASRFATYREVYDRYRALYTRLYGPRQC